MTVARRPLLLASILTILSYGLVALIETGTVSHTSAAEPEAPSHEEQLRLLQQQWQENQQKYLEEQQRLHDEANAIREELCKQGNMDHCPPEEVAKRNHLYKLAYAVAVAETSDCTAGVGRPIEQGGKNNCHGLKKGGQFIVFANKEESYKYFMDIWEKNYGGGFPTLANAQRYTAGEGVSWLSRVRAAYNRDVNVEELLASR